MRAFCLSMLLALPFQQSQGQRTCPPLDSTCCTNLLAIVHQLCEWRLGRQEINYPLMTAIPRPCLPHPQLSKSARFYSNAAALPGEYMAEYAIDEFGRCDFLSYAGPYPKLIADTLGARLRAAFLQCLPWWDWEIQGVRDTYLFLSYRPIGVTISIQRSPAGQPGNYNLVVSMFRGICIQ